MRCLGDFPSCRFWPSCGPRPAPVKAVVRISVPGWGVGTGYGVTQTTRLGPSRSPPRFHPIAPLPPVALASSAPPSSPVFPREGLCLLHPRRCPMTPTPTDFRPCCNARCNAGYASAIAMMRNDSSRHRLRGCLHPDSPGPLPGRIGFFAGVRGAERPSVACSCRLWRRTAVCGVQLPSVAQNGRLCPWFWCCYDRSTMPSMPR